MKCNPGGPHAKYYLHSDNGEWILILSVKRMDAMVISSRKKYIGITEEVQLCL